MATVKDFYNLMDCLAPFATQEGFDNAGFLVGRGDRPVERVLVALDVTEAVAVEAADWGAQLIVAHHPVIFQPARSVTDESLVGRVLLALAENRIAAICAHTNLDAAQDGVNDCLALALELTEIDRLQQAGVDVQGRPYGIGRTGTAHRPGLSAAEYAAFVKGKLGSASVRFVDGGKPVQKVAVGGGSCGSMMEEALAQGCDTFITADLKYNNFLDAQALGLNLMDAGHFPTENVVIAPLASRLAEAFPQVEVRVSRVHREVYSGI